MVENTVSLAAIGLAATLAGGIIWLAKYFAKELSVDLKEHTRAATNLSVASKSLQATVEKVGKQAEVSAKNSEEQLKFMKKLNGKLENAIIQKVAEQNVEHQTVHHVEEVKE